MIKGGKTRCDSCYRIIDGSVVVKRRGITYCTKCFVQRFLPPEPKKVVKYGGNGSKRQ